MGKPRMGILRTSRRSILRGGLGAAAAMAVSQGVPGAALAAAARGEAVDLASERLADDLFLLTGAGANVLAQTGDDGVLLVDGGNSPAVAVLAERMLDSGHVHTLFNTCWHPEHTGSNLVLGPAGVRIIAHENTRLWLTTDITHPWEPQRTHQPLPRQAQPNDTFYTTGSLGGGRVEYGYLRQAHTDGNIYVHFPEAEVIAVGGVISGSGWAEIDWWTGGWIGGLVNALDTLLEVAGESTRVVPAVGPVLSYAQLQQQRDMYATIFPRLRDLLYSGRGPTEAVQAQPTREYDEHMGDSEAFIRRAFESMWGHFTPDA